MDRFLPQPSPEDLDSFFEIVTKEKIDLSREESDRAAKKLLEIYFLYWMYTIRKEEEAENPTLPSNPQIPTKRKYRKKPKPRKPSHRRKVAPSAHKLHTTPKF